MHADNCPVWLGLERLFSPPILLFADSMLLCFYPFAHNLLSSRLKGTTEASSTIQYVLMVPSLGGNFPRDTSTDAIASRTALGDVSPDIAKPCAPRLGPRSRPIAALNRLRSHGGIGTTGRSRCLLFWLAFRSRQIYGSGPLVAFAK